MWFGSRTSVRLLNKSCAMTDMTDKIWHDMIWYDTIWWLIYIYVNEWMINSHGIWIWGSYSNMIYMTYIVSYIYRTYDIDLSILVSSKNLDQKIRTQAFQIWHIQIK